MPTKTSRKIGWTLLSAYCATKWIEIIRRSSSRPFGERDTPFGMARKHAEAAHSSPPDRMVFRGSHRGVVRFWLWGLPRNTPQHSPNGGRGTEDPRRQHPADDSANNPGGRAGQVAR